MKKIKFAFLATALVAITLAVYTSIQSILLIESNGASVSNYLYIIRPVFLLICAGAYIRFLFLREAQIPKYYFRIFIWSMVCIFCNLILGIVSYLSVMFCRELLVRASVGGFWRSPFNTSTNTASQTERHKTNATSPQELSLNDIDYLKNSSKISEEEYETLKEDIIKDGNKE